MTSSASSGLRRALSPQVRRRLGNAWACGWMQLAARGAWPRAATWMAGLAVPPYYGRHGLAKFHPRGYTAPTARIHHAALTRAAHTSVADRVIIFQDRRGGPVGIGARSTLNFDVCIQTGEDGSVSIGADTHIQSRCQFSAYVGNIKIGDAVSIAPNSSFYSYDHEMAPDRPIREQALVSRGDVIVGDHAWIGTGAILLAGATVGEGAVVGAGAVVTGVVPPYAIAAGVPARVIGSRAESSGASRRATTAGSAS